MSTIKQLAFPPPRTHGGRRRGAGGKRRSPRPMVLHRTRPDHKARHPVHVTLRVCDELPSLRRRDLFAALLESIRRASGERFAVNHFSVQSNHVHLIVEADDKTCLSRGMQGLSIRIARALNRALGRSGKVWADRYHARPLCTPREVRNAIAYVLLNWQKHVPGASGIDPCSSGGWFDGWRELPRRAPRAPADEPPPVARAATWLGSVGWRRHGLVDPFARFA